MGQIAIKQLGICPFWNNQKCQMVKLLQKMQKQKKDQTKPPEKQSRWIGVNLTIRLLKSLVGGKTVESQFLV